MELDRSHLELLTALAEHSTLAAASGHINLSASAASRRLQEAERRLGISLVEPDGRTLRLTAAGRVMADASAKVTDQIAEAELAARWLSAGVDVPIRIGVGFFDRIVWMLPRAEDLACEVVRSPTPRATTVLDRRRVDLIIDVASPGHHDGTVLLEDELVLAASPDHELATKSTITAADLEPHRYFASDPSPLPGFEFHQFFVPGRHSPKVIVRVESFSMAMDLVARGDGVSIQPRRALESLPADVVAPLELESTINVEWFALAIDETPDQILAIEQIRSRCAPNCDP